LLVDIAVQIITMHHCDAHSLHASEMGELVYMGGPNSKAKVCALLIFTVHHVMCGVVREFEAGSRVRQPV